MGRLENETLDLLYTAMMLEGCNKGGDESTYTRLKTILLEHGYEGHGIADARNKTSRELICRALEIESLGVYRGTLDEDFGKYSDTYISRMESVLKNLTAPTRKSVVAAPASQPALAL